ncbi:MAG: hypothetical protein RR998_04920 [Oscillospiraceae bacterium]
MRLVFFEMRKNFFKKSILIVLIIFTALNIFKIFSSYEMYGKFRNDKIGKAQSAYAEIYSDVSGKMTDSKIQLIVGEYKRLLNEISEFTYSKDYDENTYTGYIMGDFNLFKFDFFEPMNYAFNYSSYSKEIANKAILNAEFFKSQNNTYEVQKNEMIADLYQNRKIESFYDYNGFEALFKYNFSSILIFLLCVFALTPVFVTEKETGMNLILQVSQSGGVKTALAKYFAAIIFVLSICMWFFLCDIATFGLRYGFDGVLSPLYGIKEFKNTPLNISILGYCFVFFGIKALSILSVSSLILLISQFPKKIIFPFIINISIIFLLIFLSDLSGRHFYEMLNLFNPASLLTPTEIFKVFSVVRIFDIPISTYSIKAFFSAFVCCGTLLAICVSSKKRGWYI